MKRALISSLEEQWCFDNAREKNAIDHEYNIHVSEKMREIFKDKAWVQPVTVFRDKEKLEFERVANKNFCPKRKLTEEEYNAFPDKDKGSKKIFLKTLVEMGVFGIILPAFFIVGIIISTNRGDDDAILFGPLLSAVSVISFWVMCAQAHERVTERLVAPESEASFGRVIMHRNEFNTSSEIAEAYYYVDVAFYDEKKYFTHVMCNRALWAALERDDEVCIYNDNIRLFRKDGKLMDADKLADNERMGFEISF